MNLAGFFDVEYLGVWLRGPDGAETCQFGLFWRLEKRFDVFGSAKAAPVMVQHEWQESAFISAI
jgi:hypothetical protein